MSIKMPDEMKTYYCRRINRHILSERMEDLTERIIVHCKYDDDNQKNSCIYSDYSRFAAFAHMNKKRCLVKLAIQRDILKQRKKLIC